MKVAKLDRDTFETMVRTYARAVFNVAYRIVNDYEDAMDITQTTFIKIYEKFDQYDPARDPFNWICKIATNESLNLVKRNSRSVPLESDLRVDARSPETECLQGEASAQLQRALMGLGLDYRIVMILRHFQNLSYREISAILELPEKTVKSRLYTAREILRTSLLKQGYTP